ncbi:MAG: carboxypeptidase-like regulatory domain-containing protein, partial [Gemmatimonadetes bacterium]|nr:carboxypeptidase-like regulatory domain-containing protein [Gemmatimonadota bacterium]
MRPGKVRWIVSALSLALGLLVATTSADAFQTLRGGQRGVVRGQVTDGSTGAPLAGVRILLDGTNVSATTGQDGTYELRNVQDAQVTVRAILIGYSSQRTTLTVVDGVGAADFRLNRAVVSLDEIVVTATGLQRKRELANATTNIIVSEVAQEVMPVSMASLIQGRAAGVQILNSSGTVGTASKIRIRGSSSISLSNETLLV